MSDEIEFADLQPAIAGASAAADLGRITEVPVEVSVEIGRTRMTIGETLGLGPGSIVTLPRLAGEPVDLMVNGKQIARGEVVVIDEEFGLRITQIVSPAQRQAAMADAEAQAPAIEPVAAPPAVEPVPVAAPEPVAVEPEPVVDAEPVPAE
jgi:flagellar motor switch protein FliN/FliY